MANNLVENRTRKASSVANAPATPLPLRAKNKHVNCKPKLFTSSATSWQG